jgi:V/A-type H+/Na+-transporting ATPase subunit I
VGSPLLMLCAVSSIFFGFMYGEVFGSEQWFTILTGVKSAPWFSPVEHPTTLLRYAIYVGIAQITLGLLLDLLNKILAHRYKDALAGPIVWLWLYWSGAFLVVSYGFRVFTAIFDPSIVGVWIIPPALAMVALKLWQHRMMGLNEAFENLLVSFSHSVSYARILALKLVSSSFSALLLPASLIGIAPFIVGTVALILAFETLLAFLHTLRLHWIEWFSKFYQGTGRPFKPFAIPRQFTTFVSE